MNCREGLPWAFRVTISRCTLRCAYLSMHRRANANFARHGLTADQYVVLTAPADGEEMTQQDLVRRVHSDPNTLAPSSCDSRTWDSWNASRTRRTGAWSVSLTERGVMTHGVVWELNQGFQRDLECLFNPAELKAFLACLARVTRATNAAGQRAQARTPPA